MEKLKSNYVKGDTLNDSGVNTISSSVNEIIDEIKTKIKPDSDMEKLPTNFQNGEPFYAEDANKITSTINDIIDVVEAIPDPEADPDPTHFNIGDIVMYSIADHAKVKTSVNGYTVKKYPLDKYTPIGVVVFVLADGSARMTSLTTMSLTHPDTGEYFGSIPGGDMAAISNNELLYKYQYIGTYYIDEQSKTLNSDTLKVDTQENMSTLPTLGTNGVLSLDTVRRYNITGHAALSPYNEDGTLNEDFFAENMEYGGEEYKNTLSDINGKGNCHELLVFVNDNVPDEWKWEDEISSYWTPGSNHIQLAMATWRYHTLGTDKGEWYCPAIGELAVMVSNDLIVNNSLRKIQSETLISNITPFLVNNFQILSSTFGCSLGSQQNGITCIETTSKNIIFGKNDFEYQQHNRTYANSLVYAFYQLPAMNRTTIPNTLVEEGPNTPVEDGLVDEPGDSGENSEPNWEGSGE